jgi:hypothetical protein
MRQFKGLSNSGLHQRMLRIAGHFEGTKANHQRRPLPAKAIPAATTTARLQKRHTFVDHILNDGMVWVKLLSNCFGIGKARDRDRRNQNA